MSYNEDTSKSNMSALQTCLALQVQADGDSSLDNNESSFECDGSSYTNEELESGG